MEGRGWGGFAEGASPGKARLQAAGPLRRYLLLVAGYSSVMFWSRAIFLRISSSRLICAAYCCGVLPSG